MQSEPRMICLSAKPLGLALAAVVFGISVTPPLTYLHAQTPEEVFRPKAEDEQLPWGDITLPLPDSVIDVDARAQVELARPMDFDSLRPAVGQRLTFTLSEGLVVTAVARRVIPGDSVYRWVGRIEGPRRGSVVLAVRDGVLVTGTVRVDLDTYRIFPIDPDLHVILRVIPSALPPEALFEPRDLGIDLFPPPDDSRACDQLDLVLPEDVRITVMVLYTPLAASEYVDVAGEIFNTVDEANLAYEESGIPQWLDLVYAGQIGYDETESGFMSDHLWRLIDPTDTFMDDAHELRDTYHADIVALWVDQPGFCGLAPDPPSTESQAFAVMQPDCAVNKLAFVHELGHVMFGRHDRASDDTDGQPFNYNHGYVNPDFASDPAKAWRTVMAQNNACAAESTYCERLLFFSNPDISYIGDPTGVTWLNQDAADNRRTLSNTAATVANYRVTPVWYVAASGSAPWQMMMASDYGLEDLGFADLNGDGETDVVRADSDLRQWLVSYSGTGPWQVLNSFPYTLDQVAFGEFDGDKKADAFRPDVSEQKWYVSYAATGRWSELQESPYGLDALALGDFNADGITDVFRADRQKGEWYVSLGGTSPWRFLRTSHTPLDRLAFGDFDGDGRTDAVRYINTRGGLWQISSGASHDWQFWSRLMPRLGRVGLGDFDGDGITDAFRTDEARRRWYVRYAAKGPWDEIKKSSCQLPSLAFGDFNGDGVTDVFRPGLRP